MRFELGDLSLDVEILSPELDALVADVAAVRQVVEAIADRVVGPAITFQIGPVSEQKEKD